MKQAYNFFKDIFNLLLSIGFLYIIFNLDKITEKELISYCSIAILSEIEYYYRKLASF